MCRVSNPCYFTKLTDDEHYKFIYQQVGGNIIVDVLEYEECFDKNGMHYDYIPTVGGVSQKNTAAILGKIEKFRIPMSVKRDLRMFTQDCIIRANYHVMIGEFAK